MGAEADHDRMELLLSEFKGKDITELIAAGREKLAMVPCGGSVAAAAPAAAAGNAAPAAEAKKEEKTEKEESKDEVIFDVYHLNNLSLECTISLASLSNSVIHLQDMCFSLFD